MLTSPPQRTQDTVCHLAVYPTIPRTQTGHSTLPHATRHPTKKLLFHMGVKILSCHRGRCRYLCSVISEYLLFVSTTLKLILTKSAYFYDEFVQRKYVVGSRWWAETWKYVRQFIGWVFLRTCTVSILVSMLCRGVGAMILYYLCIGITFWYFRNVLWLPHTFFTQISNCICLLEK